MNEQVGTDEQSKESQENRLVRLFQRFRQKGRFQRRKKSSKKSLFERFLLLIPIIGIIVPAAISMLSYTTAFSRDSKKSFLDQRLKLYTEATQSAVVLSTSKDEDERTKAEKRFWELYWGELPMVEDENVELVMQKLGRCLNDSVCRNGHYLDNSRIKLISLALAHTIRKSLGNTYDQSNDEVDKRIGKILQDADDPQLAEKERETLPGILDKEAEAKEAESKNAEVAEAAQPATEPATKAVPPPAEKGTSASKARLRRNQAKRDRELANQLRNSNQNTTPTQGLYPKGGVNRNQ